MAKLTSKPDMKGSMDPEEKEEVETVQGETAAKSKTDGDTNDNIPDDANTTIATDQLNKTRLDTVGSMDPEEKEEVDIVQEETSDAKSKTDGDANSSNPDDTATISTDQPIKTRRDNGKWPTLYEEIHQMNTSAIMMYAVADLRTLGRKGQISDSVAEPFTTLPTNVGTLIPVILEHKDLFSMLLGETPETGEEGQFDYLEAILFKRDNVEQEGGEPENSVDARFNGIEILEINDENGDREMVYAISVNHLDERIEITFRGTATIRDVLVDADPFMAWFPNPVNATTRLPQDKMIGVHAGFAFYMFQTTDNFADGKARMILQSVIDLMKQYPHYRVYLTGHSLGGALATLMAFILASSHADGISKPVTCISIASPMCGNIGFLRAFQALEKTGQIRHARVANYMDIIPGLPTRVCWCLDLCCCCCCCNVNSLFQKGRYWHVGVSVHLYPGGICDITYDRRVLTYAEQVANEWSLKGTACRRMERLWKARSCGKGEGDFLRNHSCKEYTERLQLVKEKLQNRSLHTIYSLEARSSINVVRGVPQLSIVEELKDVKVLDP